MCGWAGSGGRHRLVNEVCDVDFIFFGHIEKLIAELILLAIGDAFYPGDLGDRLDRLGGRGNGYLDYHATGQRDKFFRFKADPTLADIFGQ